MPDRSPEAVLTSLLGAYQLHAVIVSQPEYCGRWYEAEPATRRGQFHLIDAGRCWVKSPVLPAPVELHKNDLIVFPRGSRHSLCSHLDSSPGKAHGGSRSDITSMLCGELDFTAGARNPILDALPDCFVVHPQDSGAAFRHLAKVLSSTARESLLGQQVILDKLADSLFVMAVCAYAQQASDRRGLLAALADPKLAKALAAIHAQPGQDWKVEQLARASGMSRTAFAVKFSAMLGVSPYQYLTEWRIAEARRLLRDQRLSVAAVAEQLGYQSEAAFRRTFKRVAGVGPGQIRRR